VNYLPRLASNFDPLSQIARITGISHWHLAITVLYGTFPMSWAPRRTPSIHDFIKSFLKLNTEVEELKPREAECLALCHTASEGQNWYAWPQVFVCL
jgi:hypothetical protein